MWSATTSSNVHLLKKKSGQSAELRWKLNHSKIFAAYKILKYYEDKKKIDIAKATEEARKESKDLIKERWLKQ